LAGSGAPGFHLERYGLINLLYLLQAKIFLTRDEKLKVSIFELPLNQYASSLLIVLPDADAGKKTLKHFEDNLKEETFEILRQNWQMPLTHCYLPKFSLQKDFSCSKYLQDLGLKDIFSPFKADLGNLSQSKRAKGASTPGLHVADILHSASIGQFICHF
jgi:serine protease inhibitor